MSEKEQEQGQEIEELDSFHFEGTGFNDEVNEVTFPPTILEIIRSSGKFTQDQIKYLDYLVENHTESREALRDMTMVYFQAVDADSSNISQDQEKLTNNIKKTFFLEKKVVVKREEKRKHVENLRNVKEKQKEGGKREKQRKGVVVKIFHSLML